VRLLEAEGCARREAIREVEARTGASGDGDVAIVTDGFAYDPAARRPLESTANTTEAGHVVSDDVLAVHDDTAYATAGGRAPGGDDAGTAEAEDGAGGAPTTTATVMVTALVFTLCVSLKLRRRSQPRFRMREIDN
jgi:hypothetical protein